MSLVIQDPIPRAAQVTCELSGVPWRRASSRAAPGLKELKSQPRPSSFNWLHSSKVESQPCSEEGGWERTGSCSLGGDVWEDLRDLGTLSPSILMCLLCLWKAPPTPSGTGLSTSVWGN